MGAAGSPSSICGAYDRSGSHATARFCRAPSWRDGGRGNDPTKPLDDDDDDDARYPAPARTFCETSTRSLCVSVAGPDGLVESGPELHTELVMATRGCSWIPLTTRPLSDGGGFRPEPHASASPLATIYGGSIEAPADAGACASACSRVGGGPIGRLGRLPSRRTRAPRRR